MSRQQDKVLRAMISLREFTAADLQAHSEVGHGTIRTVLRRFSAALEPPERVANGERGGQPCKYRIRPDRIGHLIDRMLVYTPIDGSELDDQRRRLLDLSVAHESLVKIFGRESTPAECRQLLELVEADIATARKQLAILPKDDRDFARYAHRIEEVNLLYLERRQLLDRSEETEEGIRRLEKAVGEAGTKTEVEDEERATVFLIDAGPSAEKFKWGRTLCLEMDRDASARTKLVRLFGNPDGIYEACLAREPVAGCIMAVDSSFGEVGQLMPAVQYLQQLPGLMPILIVDAHQNLEFQRRVSMHNGFYTCRDFYQYRNDSVDPSSVLRFFSTIVQTLRVAHHLVRDRTVYEAGRSVLNQFLQG